MYLSSHLSPLFFFFKQKTAYEIVSRDWSSDVCSSDLGTHTVKSGVQAARMGFDVFRPEDPSGQYVFGAGFTQGPNPAVASTTAGFGFATFLLGAPTGGQITGDPRFFASQKYVAPYVQDDWKVANTLTINLGMRYEYQ